MAHEWGVLGSVHNPWVGVLSHHWSHKPGVRVMPPSPGVMTLGQDPVLSLLIGALLAPGHFHSVTESYPCSQQLYLLHVAPHWKVLSYAKSLRALPVLVLVETVGLQSWGPKEKQSSMRYGYVCICTRAYGCVSGR